MCISEKQFNDHKENMNYRMNDIKEDLHKMFDEIKKDTSEIRDLMRQQNSRVEKSEKKILSLEKDREAFEKQYASALSNRLKTCPQTIDMVSVKEFMIRHDTEKETLAEVSKKNHNKVLLAVGLTALLTFYLNIIHPLLVN